MNEHLPMSTKIGKLSGDPLAFHLHKNRQFFHKLEKKATHFDSIEDVSKRMED